MNNRNAHSGRPPAVPVLRRRGSGAPAPYQPQYLPARRSAGPPRQYVPAPPARSGAPARYGAPEGYRAPYAPAPVRLRLASRRSAAGIPGLGWGLALLVGGMVAFAAILMAGLALVYAYYQAGERILPNVEVSGVPLGGLTHQEAKDVLQATWEWTTQVQVTNGTQAQNVTPYELGLHIDAARTTEEAYSIGHSGSMLLEMAQLASAFTRGWQVEPVVAVDETAARAGLEKLTLAMSQPPKDAGLKIEGTTITAIPGELGYTINIPATLEAMQQNPAAVMQERRLAVVPMPVPPAVIDVSPAIAEAQRLLDTPLAVQAYDAISNENLSWPVPRETIAGWLKVVQGENGPQVALDEAQVAAYLENLGTSLGEARYIKGEPNAAPLAEALRTGQVYYTAISHRPTTYTVKPGDTLLKIGWNLGIPYWMIARANPDINPDAVPAGTVLTIPSKDDLLPLPVVPGKRIVISISRQHMWIFENNQQIREFVISTGIDRSPTQPGVFQVQAHDINAYASVWNLYMPHWLSIYEAWPGFFNGIHGLPTLANGRRLWANILGKPASYGCIILDLPNAEWLYNWAENGTVVEIQP